MLGITNAIQTKIKQIIHRYNDLIYWLDGTDYMDHSKLNCPTVKGTQITLTVSNIGEYQNVPCYGTTAAASNQGLYTNNTSCEIGTMTMMLWCSVTNSANWCGISTINQNMPTLAPNAVDFRRRPDGWRPCLGVRHANSGVGDTYLGDVAYCGQNQWHHWCLSVSAVTHKLYWDGILVYTSNWTNGAPSGIVHNAGIFRCGDSTNGITGLISDARWYNAVLSDEDISVIFSAGPQQHR